MLPKQHRLKKKKDFENAFKKGKGIKGDFLFLKFIPNKLQESRFGIVVSQKVALRAVERNKIKRRIRAVLNLELPEIKKGLDMVLAVLPKVKNKSFKEIQEAVSQLLKKIKTK